MGTGLSYRVPGLKRGTLPIGIRMPLESRLTAERLRDKTRPFSNPADAYPAGRR